LFPGKVKHPPLILPVVLPTVVPKKGFLSIVLSYSSIESNPKTQLSILPFLSGKFK